jgi:hypothetical protein
VSGRGGTASILLVPSVRTWVFVVGLLAAVLIVVVLWRVQGSRPDSCGRCEPVMQTQTALR